MRLLLPLSPALQAVIPDTMAALSSLLSMICLIALSLASAKALAASAWLYRLEPPASAVTRSFMHFRAFRKTGSWNLQEEQVLISWLGVVMQMMNVHVQKMWGAC